MKARSFTLKTEYIELQQLLKAMDLISSGGDARTFLADNTVALNSEHENRRGRKIRSGDVIQVNDNLTINVV